MTAEQTPEQRRKNRYHKLYLLYTMGYILFCCALAFMTRRYWGLSSLPLAYLLGDLVAKHCSPFASRKILKLNVKHLWWQALASFWLILIINWLVVGLLLLAIKFEFQSGLFLKHLSFQQGQAVFLETHHWLDWFFYAMAHVFIILRLSKTKDRQPEN